MFTLMVIMALVTTAMTGPLVRITYPDRVIQREIDAADRAEAGDAEAYTVLVALPGERAAEFAELATQLAGREDPARVVLCRLLPAPPRLEVGSGVTSELAVIAAAGDELRGLATRLESDGRIRASVIVRFAVDPEAELAALAGTIGADLVVAAAPPGRTGTGTGLPRPAGVAGVEVRLGTGSPADPRVVVLVDGDVGGRAAVRLGAQLALAREGELVVAGTAGKRAARQAAAAIAALRRAGVPVEAANEDAESVAGVLVTAASSEPAGGTDESVTLLRVHADDADQDDELDQVVARIRIAEPAR
jgi:hypothetical protein